MHKGILAGRLLDARNRITAAAAAAVSNPELLDKLQTAQHQKRSEIRLLYELEAVADIMEHLDAQEPKSAGLSLDEVLAVPGLTVTSKKALEAHFNGPAE